MDKQQLEKDVELLKREKVRLSAEIRRLRSTWIIRKKSLKWKSHSKRFE